MNKVFCCDYTLLALIGPYTDKYVVKCNSHYNLTIHVPRILKKLQLVLHKRFGVLKATLEVAGHCAVRPTYEGIPFSLIRHGWTTEVPICVCKDMKINCFQNLRFGSNSE